ncbi:MAG: pyridoxal 5'-phosphate synthase glutaminase subunit PdxT [Anaerolineales bacterium]|nr:pyridoxal 5'-phosphate synthase glutaminase subunit PdxT [Anaerolineales bacterium]
MKIGVLALQGDFAEHIAVLNGLAIETVEIRLPNQIDGLSGIIIPGGESTTIGKLASSYGLLEPLRSFGEIRPIWGTCAGAIFLSKDAQREQPLLNLMDISVERNAFGRQIESFETNLYVPALTNPERPYRAVFIRAPIIESVGNGVEVLARLDGNTRLNESIVAARQGHLLATSFHPELTADDRFHRLFLSMVES